MVFVSGSESRNFSFYNDLQNHNQNNIDMLYIYIILSVALALFQVGHSLRFSSWVNLLLSLASHLGDQSWRFSSHGVFSWCSTTFLELKVFLQWMFLKMWHSANIVVQPHAHILDLLISYSMVELQLWGLAPPS